MRTHKSPLLACLGLAVLLAATAAHAAPIAVNNASFESANFPGGNAWTNNLTDADPGTTIEWMERDGQGDGDAFIEQIGGFVSQGVYHVGVATGYFIWQDTTIPWAADTHYTLTVGIGNRAGQTNAANLSVIGLTNQTPVGTNTADVLATDAVLAAANISQNVTTVTAAGSFADLTLEFDTDSNPPSGNIVVFLGDNSTAGRSHFDNVRLDAIGSTDSDMDGLPRDWEMANGLDDNDNGENPNNNGVAGNPDNGPDGDPDGDGLTNIREFNNGINGTDPQDDDTDDDNLVDGDEVDVHLTDPLDEDSDDDTLLDGDEVNGASGFVTNPLTALSDPDEFEDQAELALGSDPTDGNSVPVLTDDVVIGINFEGGELGGAPGVEVTGSAGLTPQSNWNNLEGAMGDNVTLIDSAGGATVLRTSWVADGTYTINGDTPFDQNAALMRGFLRTRNGVTTAVTVRNIAYPTYDVYIYGDGRSTTQATNYTVNGVTYNNVGDIGNWPVLNGGDVFVPAVTSNRVGNYVVFRGVTGATLTVGAANAVGDQNGPINGLQIVRAEVDTDTDGMPDIYEIANSLLPGTNDADDDFDSDDLLNGEEFTLGTRPGVTDTDVDGLLDGYETGDGIFDSVTDTGTDPLDRDSDDDTLLDGIENASLVFNGAGDPGTNPHLLDTDMDGFEDNYEIANGSNPVDGGMTPPIPPVIGYWPFDDLALQTEDLATVPHPGTVNGGATFVLGHSGVAGDSAISFDGLDDSVTTTVPLLDARTEFTMMGWVKFDVAQADRTGFFGQNDNIEFGMLTANSLTAYTNGAANIAAAFGPTAPDWVHVTFRSSPTERVIYLDGVRAATDVGLATTVMTAFNFNIGGGGIWDGTGNFFNGQIDDVAVFAVALPEGFITQIATQMITPLGTVPVGDQPFEITSITRDGTDLTITFNSVPGTNYELDFFDETTGGGWFGLVDLQASGVTSVFTTSLEPGQDYRLYRVRQQ